MKAKRIAALGAILPLALLCACGGGSSALTLSRNWHADTSKQEITDISEKLDYDISFDGSSNTNDLKPDYTGTYTYALVNTTMTIEEKVVPVYRLHGEAKYQVTLTLGEDSLTFTDSVESDVWFRGVADELRPVRSTKTVSETVPLLKSGAKLEECYERHNYTQTVDYDADAKNAALSLKYVQDETDGEEGSAAGRDYEGTVKLKGSSTLLDNEEILFALRGLNLESSVAFRTVDFSRRRQSNVSVSVSDSVSEARSFTRNGEAYSATIDIARVTIAYSGSNGGYSQKLEYARKSSDPYNNENRNVLLYSEQTILNGFGVIKYTLRSADFS